MDARVRTRWPRRDMPDTPLVWLGTNGRGAMTHTPIRWGTLYSRYDALLAANLDPDVPEDRWVMLTRMRAWVVFQGYSQEIRHDCLESFHYDSETQAAWRFHIPTGQGQSIHLNIAMRMRPSSNTVQVMFSRTPADLVPNNGLPNDQPVRLIVRPDIEDRNFHTTTKAYLGPENHYPASVRPEPAGFTFQPDPQRRLRMTASRGDYVHEPEWAYMVHRPLEAERGLEADSDLFSPGYFTTLLAGAEQQVITARAITGNGRNGRHVRRTSIVRGCHRYAQGIIFYQILPSGRPCSSLSSNGGILPPSSPVIPGFWTGDGIRSFSAAAWWPPA